MGGCEAHRTTGLALAGEQESHFVKVHDNDYLRADKRLYMTDAPKVFDDGVEQAAKTALTSTLQSQMSEHGEPNIDGAAKIVGCWNGLAKRTGLTPEGEGFKPGGPPATSWARGRPSSGLSTANRSSPTGTVGSSTAPTTGRRIPATSPTCWAAPSR